MTLLSSAIGIFVGAVQGYFGGKTDIILQRLIEIWESMPQMFYSDYCCKRVCAEFWDAAGDFAAVFMDGTDGNGTGGISAGAQF